MTTPNSQIPPLPKDVTDRLGMLREHIQAGRHEQAAYTSRKIPPQYQGHPAVLSIRGAFECKCNRFDVGLPLMERACLADPSNPAFISDYAEMLWVSDQRQKCLDLLETHHKNHPTSLRPIKQLSDYYYRLGMVPIAFAYARKMADLAPDDVDTLYFLGYRNTDLRRYEQGIAHFEHAAAVSPADDRAIQGRVFAMLYHGADPRSVRSVTEAWASLANAHVPRFQPKPRALDGKLRIAYLSGDLRNHVVNSFFEDVLKNHDHSRVHLTCYSNCELEDDISARLGTYCDRWRHVRKIGDDELADVIRADGIDVLIDLGGHTDSSRLSVLARRPAPVQASYLGYPATTGMPEVDYRITDAIADPPGMTDDFHTEKLFRLPRCAWAFRQHQESDVDITEPGPVLREELGGVFTFGSFNLLTKVNQASVNLWARALAACADINAGARILMTDRRNLLADREGVDILTAEYAAGGADLARVLLASWVPDSRVQRRRLREVDCMFDPLSYNGTTTTCEALWHGVPTLPLPGNSHVSRVGASLLTAIGLPEFIATSESDFIAKAAALVRDPSPLKPLRPTLRDRFAQSDLGNFKSLATALEDAYFTMHAEKLKVV
jgi:protein O-GlcNAc transferase